MSNHRNSDDDFVSASGSITAIEIIGITAGILFVVALASGIFDGMVPWK